MNIEKQMIGQIHEQQCLGRVIRAVLYSVSPLYGRPGDMTGSHSSKQRERRDAELLKQQQPQQPQQQQQQWYSIT